MHARFLLALLLLGCGWAAAPASAAAGLEIIYSANLNGELEPCGCSAEGNLGGLRRRLTLIERLRAEQPDLVLLSGGGLFSTEGVTHHITSRFIQSGLQRMNYDVVGVQWGDLVYGLDFLEQADLPRVASNWRGDELTRSRRVRRGGVELAYFQWLDQSESPYAGLPAAQQPASADTGALAAALAAARQDGALTLLATSLPPERAAQILPLQHVDLLLAASRHEQFDEPRRFGDGGVLLLRAGSRGQRLGRLSLTLDTAGRIAEWRHQVLTLPASIADAPALDAWYAEFSDALRQDYVERIGKATAARQGQGPFAGGDACAACHARAHQVWQDSAHAGAYAVLQGVNKAFDANCIGCHVVGFGADGGFIDTGITPGLSNVQCESCHGPGRDHLLDPRVAPPANAAAACAGCHNPAHSPGFDFATYWPRVQHPNGD